jgi:hypothetical protein
MTWHTLQLCFDSASQVWGVLPDRDKDFLP